MNLNRYNLGFGFFGPLEQCEEGKLMLADEVMDRVNRIIDFAEKRKVIADEALSLCDKYSNQLKVVTNDLSEERKKNKRLVIAVSVSMALALLNAALIVFKTPLLN